jgi:hypothetical protein
MSTEQMEREGLSISGVSMLAALPLLLLQFIYLLDVNGWSVELSYGLSLVVFPAIALGLLMYFGIESYLRAKRFDGIRGFPWFTLIGLFGLLSFFHAGEWFKPLVLRNPNWCRVYQVVEWTIPASGCYTLVLVGRGNTSDYEFTSAYLNWSGSEPASISKVEFRPIRFGEWEGCDHVVVDASSDELHRRLVPSGLSGAQLASLSPAIWDVLQKVDAGKTVSSATGNVQPIRDAPFGNEHVVLGGIAWMVVLLLLFVLVGRMTLEGLTAASD